MPFTGDTAMAATNRPLALLGAPSALGIRPYDSGELRHVDRAPRVLRELGLARRLGARDLGDVLPPPYIDVVRPPGGVRNEAAVARYTRALAARIAEASHAGEFVLLLAGECSVVLG